MTTNLAQKKLQLEFRVPTDEYAYISLKTDGNIDEAIALNKIIRMAFDKEDKPAKKLSLVTPVKVEAPKAVESEPSYGEELNSQVSGEPEKCDYCEGTSFWDNTENKQNYENFSPSYACKNKACGGKYYTEKGIWWKKK